MSSIFDKNRTMEQRRQAVSNMYDFLVKGGIADTTRMPSEILEQGRKATLHRYLPLTDTVKGDPVLLVPPLGSQSVCFDLRRGNSLTEHMLSEGRRVYLVDYGEIALADRDLGVEHWVSDVLPAAIRRVSADNGGAPVNLLGWCLGGLIALLSTAAWGDELPIKSVTMVASPFDFSKSTLLAPVRKAGKVTGGRVLGSVFKVMGGVPAQIVGPAFKATSITTYLKKPITLIKHRDDREFLAQVEAVDGLMNSMLAYPGRATLQVYQRLVQQNDLADGTIQGPKKLVKLADVRVPVMNIAGATDVLVPVAVAHHVGSLLPNSPDVRLEIAPGGHLGVLTGRSAVSTTWPMIDDFLDGKSA